ncbi:MAG: hypothetical protein ACI4RF_05935 [Eubacterium sp.]
MNISDIGNKSIPLFGDGGLSAADKEKLNGIETGATKTVIDSILNDTSTNPVQNKIVYAALLDKEDKSNLVELIDTDIAITLESNYEYRCGEVSSVTITIPTTPDNDFISSVVFTSGATATNYTIDTSVKFTGTDCIDEIFAPTANMRYNIIIWYDGVNMCGAVQGNTV